MTPQALPWLDASGMVNHIHGMTFKTMFQSFSGGWISALGVLPFFQASRQKETGSADATTRDAAVLLADAARINGDARTAFRKFQQAIHA